MHANEEQVEGLLLIDKPSGPSSHDMVNLVRRLLKTRKVGHGGTLDPLASGLLVMMIGRATKLAPYICVGPKEYVGSMILGITTDTLDIEGKVLSQAGYEGSPGEISAAIASLVGEIKQQPPMFSAAKFKGKPLYRYARQGVDVPRKERMVQLHAAEMTALEAVESGWCCDFRLRCSPGFYVRDFVSRVGDLLGCGATLYRLCRISSGPFKLQEALTIEELERRWGCGDRQLMTISQALSDFKRVVIDESALVPARHRAPGEAGNVF
jgi:tRNA pseudouridine55 synthase